MSVNQESSQAKHRAGICALLLALIIGVIASGCRDPIDSPYPPPPPPAAP